ncbi:unnamed protein product [Clonostachys byssicola]|uniref:Major facilitator superfamily (MFS) profile domain-containing protein n=1 Tax=Clonostachys byssicola TaxID=160290 RepID=A0A9N9UJT2_9HYPO|nr:unnamed protein product [Clonostachys byssicola]
MWYILESHRLMLFATQDSTILAVAIPSITRHFGTTEHIGWYLSIYRITSGSFQPMVGKLYSLMPPKLLVLVSLAIFIAGVAISAAAPSSVVFIIGRAIVGLGTAGVTAGVFAIIIQLCHLRRRPTYASIGAATEAMASLAAPLLGGVLVDSLSWRWCFLVEIPVLTAGFLIMVIFLEVPAGKTLTGDLSLRRLSEKADIYGTALFVPAFTLLILALQWGGTKYQWSDWRVILPLVFCLVLLLVFALLQTRLGDQAVLPPRIVKRRNVLCGFLFASCNNGALSIIEYYMPTYFQVVHRVSATTSGLLVLPSGAGLVLFVPLAGALTSHCGYPNPFMLLNGLLLPVATGLLTTVSKYPETWKLLVYQALLGSSVGIGFQGPQVAVQAILSDDDAQIGISIIQLAQAMGPAVFVASAQTILKTHLPSEMADCISRPAPTEEPSVINGLDQCAEDGVVTSHYGNVLSKCFYLSCGLSVMALIGSLSMSWHSIKDKKKHQEDDLQVENVPDLCLSSLPSSGLTSPQ